MIISLSLFLLFLFHSEGVLSKKIHHLLLKLRLRPPFLFPPPPPLPSPPLPNSLRLSLNNPLLLIGGGGGRSRLLDLLRSLLSLRSLLLFKNSTVIMRPSNSALFSSSIARCALNGSLYITVAVSNELPLLSMST